MRPVAVEFDAKNQKFSRLELAKPQLDAGEILIRVTCCTICGSDLHTVSGRRAAPDRCVLGHEIIGEVEAWHSGDQPVDYHGRPLQVGQRVTWSMPVGCGRCYYCRHHLVQKCESLFKYGHQPGSDKPTGGLSTHCVLVPGTVVLPVPDCLPNHVATPANCATATVAAALRLAEETHSIKLSSVLVIGAGMLGLTAAAQLTTSEAGKVMVADVHADRLELARKFGATHCVDSGDPNRVREFVAKQTEGRGADIVFEFAGAQAAIETSLAAVRVGGCVLWAGATFSGSSVSIEPESIVRRMLTLRGLHNYLPRDLARGLEFLEQHCQRFPFVDLVARTFPLEAVEAAFEFARTNHPVRVAVVP